MVQERRWSAWEATPQTRGILSNHQTGALWSEGPMLSSQFIAVVVDLDHVAEVTFVRLSIVGLTPLLFPSCPVGRKSLGTACLRTGGGGLGSTFLTWEHLCKLLGLLGFFEGKISLFDIYLVNHVYVITYTNIINFANFFMTYSSTDRERWIQTSLDSTF